MWFNSFGFWMFFGVVALGCRMLSHRGQNWLLLAASYFFYGCWDWRFLSLILLTTAVDYTAARNVAGLESGHPGRKRWVAFSLVINLGILGAFKYFGFFVGELERLLQAIGFTGLSPVMKLTLPVGISFYTFQALSYTLDVYRGHTRPARRFSDFALYISFFPQLVAGPIERSAHLLPQVVDPRPRCDAARFRDGLFLVMSGLFLKVVLADNMAWLVTVPFSEPVERLSAPEVLLGVYAFAFQIYGDFAGYSAIAIGVAKWLGFDLMDNFARPYFALNPQDFWRRWHISLSTWLRDYLYISLGGNRGGKWRTRRNLLLTMVLGGLWHGAAWTFVIWGAIHGLWLVAHRIWAGWKPAQAKWLNGAGWKVLSMLATFHLVCLCWLFFRAESLDQALGLLRALAGEWRWTDYAATCSALILFFAGPWIALDAWIERRNESLALTLVAWPWRFGVYAYILAMMLFFPPPMPVEFIYFQF
ncbi:MAG: MBOAT family protein [Verrucomicrobiae bacterium]|nr:MBOAT family protein [Verrucomicrobiae bacterium]